MRVVRHVRVVPLGGDRRIAVEAPLDHEAVDRAEEARVVVEADLDEVVEAVGPVGRPVPVDLDDELALGRGEARAVDVGRPGDGEGRVEEGSPVGRPRGRREGPGGAPPRATWPEEPGAPAGGPA